MNRVLLLFSFILTSFLIHAQSVNKFHYKYDDNLTPEENYLSGFADTFSAYGNKYRVRMLYFNDYHDDSMALEKLNKRWTIIDSFNFSPHFSFSSDPYIDSWKNKDYNQDGYNDFVVQQKWFNLVFLYDNINKTFVKSGYYSDDSIIQISKAGKIFSDEWGFKFDNTWSNIYTIKNLKRINLGIIELKVHRSKKENGDFVPSYISIRKIFDNKEVELRRIYKPGIKDFDMQKYWHLHYKEFYSNDRDSINNNGLDSPNLFTPILN